MIPSAILELVQICALKSVENVVLSPGSRCAPLTIAFARHPKIQVRTVPDERSAAFLGLGIAQQTKKTVALVCTSGTAAYNYAPAVAEAFYQQIPLLILTADRPPEWIDQLDGQTIRQSHLYGNHVKKSFDFPVETQHPDGQWHANRIVNEALNLAAAFPPGPVHLNVPLREPFYPEAGEKLTFKGDVRIIREDTPENTLTDSAMQEIKSELANYRRVLVVAGQGQENLELHQKITAFCRATGAVFVTDIISNQQKEGNTISYHDVFLGAKQLQNAENLRPDLLITFHQSLISKNLKIFLRAQSGLQHWHVQPAGYVADTFQRLTRIIRTSSEAFFENLTASDDGLLQVFPPFTQAWQALNRKAKTVLEEFQEGSSFGEFWAAYQLLRHLPDGNLLHLANSMSVRYANLIGVADKSNVQVFANRGTSGIDGSTSTAVGSALSTDALVVLLTGDMAFLYDRNALWHNYLPKNLRILVLNNHGGGIFRMIEGPRSQPELEPFFETNQRLTAQKTAEDVGLRYTLVLNKEAFRQALPDFFNAQAGPQLLEVETDSALNYDVFAQYREKVQLIQL